MKIRCLTDTEADTKAWDAYVLGHPEGTAYQLYAWKNAVAKAYGFSAQYLLAEDDNGLCGVFPLIDFRIPLLSRTLTSLPYCDTGGVLADNNEVSRALLDHAKTLAVSQGAGCQVRSVSPLSAAGANQTDKVRMLLELPESSEQLLSGLKSKLRSQVKKPLRDGLTVKLGTGELIDTFYAVFAENMRDLGSPVHSRRWIDEVVAAYGDRCRIAVVYTPDGVPAAVGIILLHSTTISIPWASSLRRFNKLNPNMLLYWTFLAFAADKGFRQFDFGRSTPAEGTYRFKEQWGAVPHPLFWYELTTSENVAKSSPAVEMPCQWSGKRQLVTNLWSRLPAVGANWLGPRIRKYISL